MVSDSSPSFEDAAPTWPACWNDLTVKSLNTLGCQKVFPRVMMMPGCPPLGVRPL